MRTKTKIRIKTNSIFTNQYSTIIFLLFVSVFIAAIGGCNPTKEEKETKDLNYTTNGSETVEENSNISWFLQNPRTFLVDVQFPDPLDQSVDGTPSYLDKVDPKKIVAQVKAANASTIVVHSKCMRGNAYYNTQFGHKHSGIGDRDLMQEFSEAAREAGLKIIFYHVMCQDRRYWDEHPECRALITPDRAHQWNLLEDKRLVTKDEMIVCCQNGPHRDYLKNMTGELARNYDFDGFWLDWGSIWPKIAPCYCDHCKEHYKQETGREIPRTEEKFEWSVGNDWGVMSRYSKAVRAASPSEWDHYYRWRLSLNKEIIDDIIGNIKSINPDLTITTNGSATDKNMGWQFPENLDYLCNEYHFNSGMAANSFSALKQLALKPNTPFEIESWRYCCESGGERAMQVKTLPALLTEMAPVTAHGGFSQYYDQLRIDGTLDEESLEIVGQAFGEVAKRQPWARIGKRVNYAQILWSKNTDRYGNAQGTGSHGGGNWGFQQALMESHIPVSLLSETDAKAGEWRDAKVLILAAAQCLSTETSNQIREFVSNGGGLVVTGLSATSQPPDEADHKEETAMNFTLSDVIGVDFEAVSPNIFDFVSMDTKHPVVDGLPINIPLTAKATQIVTVIPHDGTKVLGTLVKDTPGFFMGSMPNERTEKAVITTTSYGKGRVVYLGMSAGTIYNKHGHHHHRQLMVNAVNWAANQIPAVTASTHETVEIVPWHDAKSGRTIVHLINRTGAGSTRGPGIQQHEAIPVHDVILELDTGLAGDIALAQPGNRKLEMRIHGDRAQVKLDKLDIWEVIELKRKKPIKKPQLDIL